MKLGWWWLPLLLLAPGPLVEGRGEPVVRVAAEITAQADRITLGDIAEVEADQPPVAQRLRSVALGYAPNVGAVRELTRDRIRLSITAAGFPQGTVRIEAPPLVRIRRSSQVVAPELAWAAVEQATLPELRTWGATARLSRLDLPPVIEVPSGLVEARAGVAGVRDPFAPFPAAIEILVDGRVAQRLNVTAQVEAFAPVAVAARELLANSRLHPTDAVIEVRRLERAASFYLRDAARLRGTSARRTVAPGETITADLLASEFVVKPGDPVKIISESGRLQVTAAGEARAAGRIGDRIQVKNNQSGLLLQAVVVDEGLVNISF
ncbi:MAG TPA: flagellar basal body P-ring formation chaperone FlgA [Blastocatellia bacterium]|nr:flagellar basal body P-ring formation chaperone FlgA [Blastocatellia bacterium]